MMAGFVCKTSPLAGSAACLSFTPLRRESMQYKKTLADAVAK
jgi:hypothetical protein